MSRDKERLLATLVKAPAQPDGAEGSSDDDTVDSMQSPYAATLHRDPLIGTQVSGYVIKDRLGTGGMGIVYEGEQPTIGKRVAIKVLRPEVAENPEVVQRLVAEARAVNQVGHRGIVDVFGFGQLPDGRQCIVMEYLDGEPLDAVLNVYAHERRVMPAGDVLVILDEVLSALASAHSAGVIHRDLKPSNIFLCKQRDGARYVKLLDFGIAKLGVMGKSTPATRASMMLGTPSYMAPEQAKGGDVGATMDLYAVGVIAFEMFTGRQPFVSDSVVGVLMAHQHDVPPAPSSILLSLPDGIDELVLKLLEKSPDARYQTADEVRAVVVKLRKELADPTRERVKLEVTINPKDRESARVAVAARTEAVARPKVVQQPEQVVPTERDLPAQEDAALDALPKSNRGPVIVLAALVLIILGGGVALLKSSDSTQAVVAEQVTAEPGPPAKAQPQTLEPAAPAAVTPEPVVAAEPQLKVPEPVVDRPVAPEPVQPEPVKPPPAVAKAAQVKPKPTASKEPAPKAEPVLAKPASAEEKSTKLTARLGKLGDRLNRAAAGGANVELYLKQVKKIRARLDDASLTDDERERLEVAISRLEQSTDY